MFGQGLDVHVEPLLHLVEHLGVLLRGHEGDAKTLGPKAASTPHPVKIRVGAIAMLLVCDRHVIVDHNVDTLNVNATAHQVGGNQDALLALLELLVPLNALSLRKLGVDGDGGEIALAQQLVQCHGARDGLNEDHHLVEVQGVQQVVKLAVLVTLLQHDVVLHEAMERELGLVVNVDLHGVCHEFLADGPNFLGEGGGEHHHLLVVGGGDEDLLDVAAHIEAIQHLVALVQHKVAHRGQVKKLLVAQRQHAPGRAHHNVRRVLLQHLLVLLDRQAPEEIGHLDALKVPAKALKLVADLERQLTGVAQHDGRHLALLRLQLLQHGQHEDCSLTHTRLGLANDVHAQDGLWDALMLDFTGMLEAAVLDGAQQLRLE
mmetsp:Transcript_13392/g.34357  ORF Transcript_13392/g.34357 Transcript_13392/m.34357 type:complete len:374 (-) Transcript_13392:267-1388(-)